MKTVIFDSGLGSLKIYNELKNRKGIWIRYNDSENYPYGTKSKKELLNVITSTIKIIIEKYHPDRIIMASITPTLQIIDKLRFSVPIIGMYPDIITATSISKTRKVLILSTNGALRDIKKYCNKFNNLKKYYQPGSNLVDMVEKKKYDLDEIKKTIEPYYLKGVDTIILGSTHLTYLINKINKIYPNLKLLKPKFRGLNSFLQNVGTRTAKT